MFESPQHRLAPGQREPDRSATLLDRFSVFPIIVAGMILIVAAIVVSLGAAPSRQPGSTSRLTGETLAIDTVFHLLALVVALVYARTNQRGVGALLAVLSPLIFLVVGLGGSSEQSDFWGTAPTDSSLLVGYVASNLVLAVGLVIAARRPKQGRGKAADWTKQAGTAGGPAAGTEDPAKPAAPTP